MLLIKIPTSFCSPSRHLAACSHLALAIRSHTAHKTHTSRFTLINYISLQKQMERKAKRTPFSSRKLKWNHALITIDVHNKMYMGGSRLLPHTQCNMHIKKHQRRQQQQQQKNKQCRERYRKVWKRKLKSNKIQWTRTRTHYTAMHTMKCIESIKIGIPVSILFYVRCFCCFLFHLALI